MVKYVFKDEQPVRLKNAAKADAQKIGTALEEIAAQNNGEVTPVTIVDAARNPKSPLHPHFEWDTTAAAEAYRREQARDLIRIVRIRDETRAEPPRAFLSVTTKKGVSYRRLNDVLESVSLSSAVLDQAERDLLAFERRYQDLLEVCNIVAEARAKVKELKTRRAPKFEDAIV